MTDISNHQNPDNKIGNFFIVVINPKSSSQHFESTQPSIYLYWVLRSKTLINLFKTG